MKLALGTVQFGLDYGTFGTGKQLSMDHVNMVLARAKESGIDLLDTARAYGSSELVLGKVRASEQFQIVTKCPKLPTNEDPVKALRSAFTQSCEALGVDRVYGYLLHDATDLTREGVWEALQALNASGRAVKVGVSAYSYEEAAALCQKYKLSLVQLPANVLTPWFKSSAIPNHVEVHVRSVFLQGFLLSDPIKLPEHFLRWRSTLEVFRERAFQLGLSPLEAALAPVIQSTSIHRVLVGIDRFEQLENILTAAAKVSEAGAVDLGAFPEVTSLLTDPRTWNK